MRNTLKLEIEQPIKVCHDNRHDNVVVVAAPTSGIFMGFQVRSAGKKKFFSRSFPTLLCVLSEPELN